MPNLKIMTFMSKLCAADEYAQENIFNDLYSNIQSNQTGTIVVTIMQHNVANAIYLFF